MRYFRTILVLLTLGCVACSVGTVVAQGEGAGPSFVVDPTVKDIGNEGEAGSLAYAISRSRPGTTILLPPGNVYRLLTPVTISNRRVVATGAEVEVSGENPSAFASGALRLVDGAEWMGGILYSSGSMAAIWADGYSGRTSIVAVERGSILRSATIYSQLFCAVKTLSQFSVLDCTVYGGKYAGIFGTGDASKSVLRGNYLYNSGAIYVNKSYAGYWDKGGNGASFNFTSNVKGFEIRGNRIFYQGASGIWVQTNDYKNGKFTVDELVVAGNEVRHSGWVEAGGAKVPVNGSGTNIEIITALGAAIVDNVAIEARGYNYALSYSSKSTFTGNTGVGSGGDPVLVIADCTDTLVSNNVITGGTVGVSVGEDNHPSHNTRIIANVISGNSYGALRFDSGLGLHIHNNYIENLSLSEHYQGKWSGEPKHRRAVDVREKADLIFSSNNTWKGIYNSIFESPVGTTKTINSIGEFFQCLYVEPKGLTPAQRRLSPGSVVSGLYHTTKLHPAIDGPFGSGTVTIKSGASYLAQAVAPEQTDFSQFLGSKSVQSSAAENYYVLFYVRKTSAMSRGLGETGELRCGFTDKGNLDGGERRIYASVAFQGFGDNEWVPVTYPLKEAVNASVADYAKVTHFVMAKHGGNNYDYEVEFSNPVLIVLPSGCKL